MFKNYIKIAFRNLKKDKQFTFLNMLGLSAGIACTLLIYLWVHDELSYDKFFDNNNQIYQVMEHRKNSGSQGLTDESSGLLSDVIKVQESDVKYAAAVAPPDWFQKSTLTVGDKSIRAKGQYVGKDYFKIFSFKMISGDRYKVLDAKTSIVISEDLAKRLFNTTDNIIGKGIRVQQDKMVFVSGVYQLPVHSSQQFDFAQPFDYLAEDVPGQNWVKSWGGGGPHNFIMLKEGTDINAFNKRIANLVTRNTGDTARTPFAMCFSDNYLQNTFNHGSRVGGRAEYVKLFSLVALFILIIACINFMNLSTARASGRMKEVGIKKVIGAERSQLIIQFLSESTLMAFITTALAVGIAWLLLPQFNQLTGKVIQLDFTPSLIATLAGIALFTGIVSGSYPALYLSKFQPLAILKGKFNSSFSDLIARKGLVVFQFTISVMLIVAVLVVYRQINFIQSVNPGYSKENIIKFDTEGKLLGHEGEFADQLKNIPGVVNASYTTHNMVGRNFGTAGLSWDGRSSNKDVYFEGFFAGFNFVETMGMQMTAGRSFSKDFGADGNKVLVNETAVKTMNLKNPIGQNMKIFGGSFQIIGVLKDFHFESLHETVKPMFMLLRGQDNSGFRMMIRIKADHQQETIAQIQKAYESYNPGFPFTYNFLDEAYQKQYETEVRVSLLAEYFSGLAIIISCLGLFGLVAFTAQKRRKEIGIRKVVGASVKNITFMLTKDFLKLVFIAVLVALPVSWWLMSQWLNGFAYRTDISLIVFIVAVVSVIMITIITVSFQAVKAALVNPVKSLRSE